MSQAKDLSEELAEQVENIEWSALKPHAERGAAILVSPEISLIEAGTKVVADDVATVEAWLSEKKLVKVGPDEIAKLDQAPDKVFQFVILQPFVLMQEQRH